jgi:hypothetical protein
MHRRLLSTWSEIHALSSESLGVEATMRRGIVKYEQRLLAWVQLVEYLQSDVQLLAELLQVPVFLTVLARLDSPSSIPIILITDAQVLGKYESSLPFFHDEI